MDRSYLVLYEDELATKARATLRSRGLRVLPVVDDHKRVVGMISRASSASEGFDEHRRVARNRPRLEELLAAGRLQAELLAAGRLQAHGAAVQVGLLKIILTQKSPYVWQLPS